MEENPIDDVLTGDEPEAKGKGLLPMVAILIVTLAGGGFVGAKTLGPALGPALAARAEAAPKKGGHGGEAEVSPLHVVDNLVVNPASSGGSRFLLTSIALETTDPEAAAGLEARDLEIRDAFNMVLGTKTVEELTDITLRRSITAELMVAIEALVGPGVVHRILIPQFVIQ